MGAVSIFLRTHLSFTWVNSANIKKNKKAFSTIRFKGFQEIFVFMSVLHFFQGTSRFGAKLHFKIFNSRFNVMSQWPDSKNEVNYRLTSGFFSVLNSLNVFPISAVMLSFSLESSDNSIFSAILNNAKKGCTSQIRCASSLISSTRADCLIA